MKPFILISTMLIIWIVIAFQVVVPEPVAPKQVGDIGVIWNRANATNVVNFGLHEYGEANPDPSPEEDRQPRYLEQPCATYIAYITQFPDDLITRRKPCAFCHCDYYTVPDYDGIRGDFFCRAENGVEVSWTTWRNDPTINHPERY
jgi:hypothetical protein